MISYVIPTKDRPGRLASTLAAIGSLGDHAGLGGAEVVVVDNASSAVVRTPAVLASGVPVRVVRSSANLGAAGRNLGVSACDGRSGWVVMLDDDSHPVDLGLTDALRDAGPGVAAVAAEVLVADGRGLISGRERGGLPEVFIGCGAALRREVFERLGGYDVGMGYYAEEYDLAARMLLSGYRVAFDGRFRVAHHREPARRDINLTVRRLVRNNGWIARRYTPAADLRRRSIVERRRYREIARREGGLAGYAAGLAELRRTLALQRRVEMSAEIDDRFTGLAYAREALGAAWSRTRFRSAELIDHGKHAWVVARVLDELGVSVRAGGEARVIATMSPGPMMDALERRRASGESVIAPWEYAERHAGGPARRAA
ncbi:MAG: glycosyltransferase [Phycisphaeraceae bacterium]|nr:MAG: glycosyltransferase [Phycisphaeraceae bacterium]